MSVITAKEGGHLLQNALGSGDARQRPGARMSPAQVREVRRVVPPGDRVPLQATPPPPPPPLHDAGLGPSATNGDIRGTAPTPPPPAQSRHRDYEGMPRTEREGGFGTRPWWLALLPCGGAYWPLALEPSAMTRRPLHYCGHPPALGGGDSRMHLLPMASSPDGLISAQYAVITKAPGGEVLTTTSNASVTQGHGCWITNV